MNNKPIEIVNQKRYIEINSAYRNRNEYPNPAQFKVNVANAGQKIGGINALDPFSAGSPVLSFQVPATLASGNMAGTNTSPRVSGLNFADDYFNGTILVDTTTSESSIITGWNNRLKTFTLETPFSNAFTSGDAYSITNPSSNSIVYANLDPSVLNDTFVGQLLYDLTINEYDTIIDYDPLTKRITLQTGFGGGWANTDYYEIVSQEAIRVNTATAITTTTVTLDAGASATDGEYVGQFVRLTNTATPPPTVAEYGTRVITAYNGTTKVATFSPPVASGIAAPLRFQILQFTRDQYSFVNYVGRESKERALYRLTLDNLILPNQTLNNRFGGSIAFYPYVYLVFSNDNIGTNSLLNSNNPNSQRAVFRCPITDTPNPDLSTFVKVRSTMINVMRFSPWEDLKFEVFLSDGTLFQTTIQDNTPPERPQPGIQISCTVAFERLQ